MSCPDNSCHNSPGTFQGDPFEVAMNGLEFALRIEALKHIHNPNQFILLAKSAPDPEVRRRALEFVSDLDVLAEIVCRECDYFVRLAAIRKISCSKTLTSLIVKVQDDYYLCKDALKNITNNDLLFSLTEVLADRDIIAAVIQVMTDQTYLEKIARTHPDYYLRSLAIRKIIDQSVLMHLAKDDPDYFVRAIAIKHLDNQAVIENVAKSDSDYFVRLQAVSRLTNQEVLAEIAELDNNPQVKDKAIRGIVCTHVLQTLANRLNDYALVEKIRVRIRNLEGKTEP